jgi:hypothetical protein
MSQFNNGGKAKIISKIIETLNAALKLLVLIFLLSLSKFFIPENSILIKWSPMTAKIKGTKKLIILGKKEVILMLKKLFK